MHWAVSPGWLLWEVFLVSLLWWVDESVIVADHLVAHLSVIADGINEHTTDQVRVGVTSWSSVFEVAALVGTGGAWDSDTASSVGNIV